MAILLSYLFIIFGCAGSSLLCGFSLVVRSMGCSSMQFVAASLVAHMVKNLLAKQETWVRFLGQEGPLEKEMATHSRILAWEFPWTEEHGGLQSMGSQKEHN